MRVTRHGWISLLLVTIACASTQTAVAAPSQKDDATVQTLVAKANAANDKGDLKAARDGLVEAFAIERVPAVGVALAKIHIKLGEIVEARAVLEDIAPPDAAVKETKKTQDQRAEGVQLLSVVNARIATVHIDGYPPEATISIDGAALPPGTARLPLSLNPGHHVFDAAINGASAEAIELDLAAGVERTVSFHVAGAAASSTPLPPSADKTTQTPAKRMRSQGLFVGGLVTMGLGTVVGIVGGVMFAQNAGSKTASYTTTQCDQNTGCQNIPGSETYTDEGSKTAGEALLVGGSVVALTGLVISLVGGQTVMTTSPPTKVGSFSITPAIGPRSAGAMVQF